MYDAQVHVALSSLAAWAMSQYLTGAIEHVDAANLDLSSRYGRPSLRQQNGNNSMQSEPTDGSVRGKSKRPHRRTRGANRRKAREAQTNQETGQSIENPQDKTVETVEVPKQVGGLLVDDSPAAEIAMRPSGSAHYIERPKRMADYALEARAVREGWLKTATEAQAKVASSLCEILDSPTATVREKLQASMELAIEKGTGLAAEKSTGR